MNRITNDIKRKDFAAHLSSFVTEVDNTIAAKANEMGNVNQPKSNQQISSINLLKRLKFSVKMMHDWVNGTTDSIWRDRRDEIVAKFKSYNRSRQTI